METIINTILEFARDHLILHIVIIALTTVMLLLSMAIDLVAGVRKAKERGCATTSTGFKKTCEKGRKYFSPYIELICIDMICCIIIPIPVFSMAWAAYCVFCEYKSVREKSWEKAELRKQEKTMNIIVDNKEDIAKMVVELLTQTDKNTKENGKL